MIIGVLVCLVQLLCCGWFMPWCPPSVEASLALTEPCCAGRSVPPCWCGPSCLDTESDAPLTGDRTGVSGECVCTVSCRLRGLIRFLEIFDG